MVAAVVASLLVSTFERPLLSWRGVQNAFFHLRHAEGLKGVLGSGALLVGAAPWILFPAVGAVGLRGWFAERRRPAAAGVVALLPPVVPDPARGRLLLRLRVRLGVPVPVGGPGEARGRRRRRRGGRG